MPSSACRGDPRDLHSFPTRRSSDLARNPPCDGDQEHGQRRIFGVEAAVGALDDEDPAEQRPAEDGDVGAGLDQAGAAEHFVLVQVLRSEEHTSELQSQSNLVCRLLLVAATPATYTLSLHDALPILPAIRPATATRSTANAAYSAWKLPSVRWTTRIPPSSVPPRMAM